MPQLRTLFVVPQGEIAPGPRYRVFQYLPGLRALGVVPTVLAVRPDQATARQLSRARPSRSQRFFDLVAAWRQNQFAFRDVVREAPRYDRLFVYRCPVPSWARRALSPLRDRILFDFDDALDQPELEGGPLQYWRVKVLRRGLENAVAVAGLTITSNGRNASVVQGMGGRVAVIPTSVDVSRAVTRDRRSLTAPRPVLGWIGTPTTALYLAGIEDPLSRLASVQDVAIRLVGAGRSPFARLEPELQPWSLPTEPNDVAAFDVGLMPMPDTPWTRGKAALKALQYGAAGMPTVASWTETNAAILGERDGALLCRTADDWFEALRRLLADDAFRVEMGARARRRVESGYSLDVVLPRLHRAIVDVARAGAAEDAGPARPSGGAPPVGA